ncbi:cell filamentation protein Fic [Eggerthella lenta]|uniref:protein adenylyltransferase n=1 Tax=Eggerthella lenta TaxID=84112 RepID=A0A5C5CC68_EGGLN|nr:Fic family protein [Eggerthella lenta]TNU96135.1 cell filamentation protein Fic [Eggerthella lenta]
MTADCPEDYPYEAKRELRDPAVREGYWRVAMGLQEVDGLKPSPYLRELARDHVLGVRGLDETGSMIRLYHARQEAARNDELAREREADLVSQRIVELLNSGAFALMPDMLAVIHGMLFQDLDPAVYRPGEYKTEALQKREFVLNGDCAAYADPALVERSLAFLFEEERSRAYGLEFDGAQLEHFGRFVSRLWQVHPFVEGNTRTTAVFAILYLRDLGFDVDNEPFEQHVRYFRDALVRANYRNAKAGVLPDLRFVVRFLDNLLNGAEHELRSRDLACKALFDDPSFLRNVDPSQAISL